MRKALTRNEKQKFLKNQSSEEEEFVKLVTRRKQITDTDRLEWIFKNLDIINHSDKHGYWVDGVGGPSGHTNYREAIDAVMKG